MLDLVLILHRLCAQSGIGLLQFAELEREVVDELTNQRWTRPILRRGMAARLLKQLLKFWNYVHSDQIPRLLSFLVFDLELIDLSVVVAGLVLIERLFLLESILVLGEQPLCLVVDEIAEYLKAVSLFDRLLLE